MSAGEATRPPGLDGARVVLGVTGGIAAYKAALVARGLITAGADVHVVLTAGAERFVGAATFEGLTGNPVRSSVWEDIPGETHVAIGRGADLVAVYPATAHLLARAATGLADDLLTTTLLVARCPVVVAPAMHTEMWDHPATRANVRILEDRGVTVVGPDEGELMGGDRGAGRAVEPQDFVAALTDALDRDAASRDLDGRTVVVTAAGTREPIDPVRFLGNRSSGRMGFAIAAAAAARGAKVHLVAGPTFLPTPDGVQRHDVVTALDMREVVRGLRDDADVIIKAAAVADFRPADASDRKLKKTDGPPTLRLAANPDILAELGAERSGRRPLLVGFAAETDDVEANGRAKLERKQVDLLAVNDVSRSDAGFDVETNRLVLLAADGGRTELPLSAKREVADDLLDEVVARLDRS